MVYGCRKWGKRAECRVKIIWVLIIDQNSNTGNGDGYEAGYLVVTTVVDGVLYEEGRHRGKKGPDERGRQASVECGNQKKRTQDAE